MAKTKKLKFTIVVLLLTSVALAHVEPIPMAPIFAEQLATMPIDTVITVYRQGDNEWLTWDHVPRCLWTDRPADPMNPAPHRMQNPSCPCN